MSNLTPDDMVAIDRRRREREELCGLRAQLAEAQQERQSLHSEMAHMLGQRPARLPEGVTVNDYWLRRVGDVLAERDAALAALAKYGRHLDGCGARLTRDGFCNCGLVAALSAAREQTASGEGSGA